jgi:predicted nucleic acid-binding protein
MYVADTHSFLWFLTKDERLGSKAKEIFRLCDQGREIIVIPAIVLHTSHCPSRMFVYLRKKENRFKVQRNTAKDEKYL